MEFVYCDGGRVSLSVHQPFGSRRVIAEPLLLMDIDCWEKDVCVEQSAFYLSPYPVTRREFLDWFNQHGQFSFTADQRAYWKRFEEESVYDDDAPIVSTTWLEAAQYCHFHGARLPYRSELICAVIQPGDRDESYEDDLLEDANWAHPDAVFEAHLPLRSVSNSKVPTWCGIFDLLGNADEFTLSPSHGSVRKPDRRLDTYPMRMVFMNTGIGTVNRHPANARWIEPMMCDHDPKYIFRPGQIGFRLAQDA